MAGSRHGAGPVAQRISSELLTCPAKIEEICFSADMGADKNLSAF